jgi:tetratricopeptide (TPR) repeat protein
MGEQRRILMIAGALAVPILLAVILGGRSYIQRSRASSATEAGVTALREGRAVDAKEYFVAASKIVPRDPMPHVYLSRVARERNDLPAANDEAVQAVRLAPEHGPALRELATTLYAMENFSGARAFYARAIKADATDRVSQGYLGCSLIQLGRADEGMRWIQRAGSGTWSACAREGAIARRDR